VQRSIRQSQARAAWHQVSSRLELNQISETSILVAESVVGAIEALFATAPEVGAAAHTENFGIWIQEGVDVLEPNFTVDQEGMTATVNWPASLVPATYGRQDEVQRTLLGLATAIFTTTCFVKDMQQTVERFFTNEAVLDRVSMIVVVGNSRQRIFEKAVSKLSDWTQLATMSFPLEPTRPSISRRALGSAEEGDDAAADDRRSPSLPKDHRDIGVRSVIDLHLWNRAGWTGVAFADWGLTHPPAIALMFTDEDVARKIFERWRERFGEIDKDGDIYIAIVRGVSAEHPAHYRVLITSRLPSEDDRSGNQLLTVASRIQTMHAESDANLMRFLDAYGRSQAYLLVPAILRGGGSPQFLLELAILKRKLSVKKASEVKEHEIEIMALRSE